MKAIQQLDRRNIYTPTGAPQARGNCGDVVKQGYGVGPVLHRLKTLSNNSDVDQPQHTGGHKANVYAYVLNNNGKPLMPCKPAKAKHLLKAGKAKVVKRSPFTIQLNWDCEGNTQPIKLGIDAGYKEIGFSAVSNNNELISGELKMNNTVSKHLKEKAMYRRNRRNRVWHRPPRFLNRGKEGWLAPSVRNRIDTHVSLANKLKGLLPITEVTVEVANFDTQKMQNPEISGIEYQQGTLMGYEVREYLLEKWDRKCVYCGKKDVPLEIEHIIPRSRRGTSDRITNLTLACHDCNQKKGNKTAGEFGFPEVQKRAKKPMKDATFMNIARWRIVNQLRCKHTYGYITKHNRIKCGLEKSHINDAFVIAGGTNQDRFQPFIVKQVRRNNRSIQTNRKGYDRSIRRQRYKLQPNDLVRMENEVFRISGIQSYGRYTKRQDTKQLVKTKNLELITYGKGLCFMYPEGVVKHVKETLKGEKKEEAY